MVEIVLATFTRKEDAERYTKESSLAEIYELKVKENFTKFPDRRLNFQVYYERCQLCYTLGRKECKCPQDEGEHAGS